MKNMASEMKPCPFCGGTELRIYVFDDYDQDVYIKCIECTGQINARGKAKAIEAWNRRAEEWAYVCPKCGCTVSEKSGFGKYQGHNQQLNFCPNCGAKMDGGNEDGSTQI